MTEDLKTQLEAATLRKLIRHLQEHPEVQNIDLMILADFCRNCLAKWYSAAAQEMGQDIDYAKAQEFIYGMPYPEWKEKHQTPATPEQLAKMEERQRLREASGH